MTTKIIGNQIDAATRAVVTALQVTEQINFPNLNQTQIDALGTVPLGTIIFNTTDGIFQGYLPDVGGPGTPGWDDVGGGGPSLGEDSIIRTNGTTISENITIGSTANGGAEYSNGFSAAPITIANGFTVTIENGATWTLIGADEDLNNYRYFDNVAINSHLRMVPGSTLEYGQTKEKHMSYSVGGTVTLDHSMATVFSSDNTTNYNGNFTVNFINVPNESGFVYSARVIKGQLNGSGVISGFQINGSAATLLRPSGFSNGSGYDVYDCFFYLSGSSWYIYATQSRYAFA